MELNQKPPYDFKAGAMLLVNKPATWTSFDVVNKIRYALKGKLQLKKLKVGHAGTLDPLATGLLIVCTGKYTKKIDLIQGLTKEYTGHIKLGETTPSYDAESEVNATFPTEHIKAEAIQNTVQKFMGEQNQFPPIFSAIKVNGQPLYKKARKGIEVEVKARRINILEFEVAPTLPALEFRVVCSKGTYIRSLAHDFGKALDSGAYLSSLIRTKIGDYSLTDAWELTDLIEHINSDLYFPAPGDSFD